MARFLRYVLLNTRFISVEIYINGQNGPIQLQSDYSAKPNQYSWNKLADYFWIDQPV